LRALAKQPRAVLHQNSVLGCFSSLAMTTCLVRFLKMAKLQLGAFEKKNAVVKNTIRLVSGKVGIICILLLVTQAFNRKGADVLWFEKGV
jgi:hypothetical protein